jgi:hypothetical protein
MEKLSEGFPFPLWCDVWYAVMQNEWIQIQNVYYNDLIPLAHNSNT